MCDSSNYFYYCRRIIRRLKSAVNDLEETVNVLEEALEEIIFLEGSAPEPVDQLLRTWKTHVNSFRRNIYYYDSILTDLSPQQIEEVYSSLGSYGGEVVQYIQIVQDYCSQLLISALQGMVDRFKQLVQGLKAILANNSSRLDAGRQTDYSQLVEYLDDAIRAWDGELEVHITWIEQDTFSIGDYPEINQDIMRAIARVQKLTTQVQSICRNLLEFT